jgi:hypothetical protein
MANEHHEPTTGRAAEQITLDQLISTASQSVLRALQGQPVNKQFPHPRIWVGIWIEPNHGGVLGEGPAASSRAEE